jgi:hypothetical protein
MKRHQQKGSLKQRCQAGGLAQLTQQVRKLKQAAQQLACFNPVQMAYINLCLHVNYRLELL